MNFYINTKGLQDLSFADLEALHQHIVRYEDLRRNSATLPLYTPELCTELKKAIYNAKNAKIFTSNLVSIFNGDSINQKPVHESELTIRTINAIRSHFGLATNKDITIEHVKTIHGLANTNHVRGLGVTCQREIRWFLEKLGVI